MPSSVTVPLLRHQEPRAQTWRPQNRLRTCGPPPEQARGTFALPPLDEATDGDVRWDGDHHMDMIGRDMPLPPIDARLLTRFPDHGMDPFCDLTTQYLMAILGAPDAWRGIENVVWEPWRSSLMRPSLHKICSSCRLKAGGLPVPIGDNNIMIYFAHLFVLSYIALPSPKSVHLQGLL
jgi:hypothetical protein